MFYKKSLRFRCPGVSSQLYSWLASLSVSFLVLAPSSVRWKEHTCSPLFWDEELCLWGRVKVLEKAESIHLVQRISHRLWLWLFIGISNEIPISSFTYLSHKGLFSVECCSLYSWDTWWKIFAWLFCQFSSQLFHPWPARCPGLHWVCVWVGRCVRMQEA